MNNPEGIKALVAKWRAKMEGAYMTGDPVIDARTESFDAAYTECADELESLTAVAGDAGVVARELLAAEYKATDPEYAEAVIGGMPLEDGDEIAIRAIVRALNTRQAVEGMVLVPREPTEAMLRKFTGNVDRDDCAASYTAMLAAAAPQAGKGDVR